LYFSGQNEIPGLPRADKIRKHRLLRATWGHFKRRKNYVQQRKFPIAPRVSSFSSFYSSHLLILLRFFHFPPIFFIVKNSHHGSSKCIDGKFRQHTPHIQHKLTKLQFQVGTGEYTTGFVGGGASGSDKKVGVVGLTLFDLRRRGKVGDLSMVGVSGKKFPGIRKF